MKCRIASLFACGMMAASLVRAEEKFPELKVGDDVFTNVTVTSVTATDVYFSYPGGIGNAKLKNLDPDLQKHFHFDSVSSGVAEVRQNEANAQYHEQITGGSIVTGEDLVVRDIYAKSFRGSRPPPMYVERWLTPPPDMNGKFVLIVFWSTASKTSRQAVPFWNEIAAKYKSRLVVVGMTDESAAEVRTMISPKVNFNVAIDTKARLSGALELKALPHALLLDPRGIVRFEGMPGYLSDKWIDYFLAKYAE
jgi:cytochrome c biogenesis protein CcmG/thiol:disulfide interchange protein DsbE